MIIHIYLDAISRKNGGSSSILDIANALINLGYKVKIFTFFGKLDKFIYKAEDFNHFNKVFFHNRKLLMKNKKSKLALIMSYFFTQEKPDIIIDNIHLDEVHNSKKKAKIKYILNHAGSKDAFENNFIKNYPLKYLDFIKSYDGSLFQSKNQLNELKGIIKINKSKLHHLYPSISVKQVNYYSDFQSPFNIYKKLNICIIGSIQPRKGQAKLLDIIEKMNDYNDHVDFYLIGAIIDEKYFKSILNTIELRNITNLKILGHRKDYINYIQHSDLIMQLSESEGISRIIRESFYLKVPFITFDIIGSDEIFTNNINSFVVNEGDTNKITEILTDILNNKIDLNISKLNARRTFDEKFNHINYEKTLKKIILKNYPLSTPEK